MQNITNIILKPKPAKILLYLLEETTETKIISSLAKNIDLAYSHTYKTLKILETNQIISLKKNGRSIELTLTKKGKAAAEEMKEIYDRLEGCQEK